MGNSFKMTEKRDWKKKLGFGCARLPLLDKKDQTSVDMKEFCQMVDMFLGAGFTYFDVSYIYHNYKCEIFVKEGLVARHPRNSFCLADKLPLFEIHSPKEQEKLFQHQLEKCGVDYFDVYLIHALQGDTYRKAIEYNSFEFLVDLKKRGAAKHIGISYHDNAELLDDILKQHPEIEYVQLQINYLDWEDAIVQSRRCYETARKHNCRIIVMEPIKGGRLAKVPREVELSMKKYYPDMSVASWAIRYAASLEGVEVVLSGMSNCRQMEDNLKYMQEFQPLNKEEQEFLLGIRERLTKDTVIACTACHYCTPDCPKEISIPEYFDLYNSFKRPHAAMKGVESFIYEQYFSGKGKASDCIGCGHCEEVCPQHLPVTKWLKEIAWSFEGIGDGRREKALLMKNKRIEKKYELLCEWMRLRLAGVSVKDFFDRRGIRSVAVYGAGELGRFLCEELNENSNIVKYILDKNADILPIEKNIPVYSIGDSSICPVEAVIITPVLIADEIRSSILSHSENQVIFELEEVLNELENFVMEGIQHKECI